MSKPFLEEADFFECEADSSLLSLINNKKYLQNNTAKVLAYGDRWLEYIDVDRAKDTDYDFEVPILGPDDEIIGRDVNRTFATKKYKDILTILLYKCKHKFGDYAQSMSYMGGFLLLVYDMGTAYKVLTVLNSDPVYLANSWRSEAIQSNIDGWVLFDILPKYVPSLGEYFMQIDAQPNILSISQKWFGGAFIQNIPCPYLMTVMDSFFQTGIYYIFQLSLALLRVLEPLLVQQPLHKMQEVIRLFDRGSKMVTTSLLEEALEISNTDSDLIELMNFDLTEERHFAFGKHLGLPLSQASYKEMLMPCEEEDFDDPEVYIEDGVLDFKSWIQDKKIKVEFLPSIFTSLLNDKETFI